MAENVQKLSVLIIHEGDLLVAQCLEHDIATQCPTQELALAEFITALVEQIGLDEADGIGPLSKVAAAPDEYRERFESENAKTVPSQTVQDIRQGLSRELCLGVLNNFLLTVKASAQLRVCPGATPSFFDINAIII